MNSQVWIGINFIGLNGDSWGFMEINNILVLAINPHSSPLIPMTINGRKLIPMNPHSPLIRHPLMYVQNFAHTHANFAYAHTRNHEICARAQTSLACGGCSYTLVFFLTILWRALLVSSSALFSSAFSLFSSMTSSRKALYSFPTRLFEWMLVTINSRAIRIESLPIVAIKDTSYTWG